MDYVRYLLAIRENTTVSLVISLALLLVCFGLRYFTPLELKYVTFYPAIILATLAGGWIMGACITALAALLAVYFFISPFSLLEMKEAEIWGLGAFLLVSVLIIAITDILVNILSHVAQQTRQLSASEAHTKVLMREISHRMKNQYAVILAMARSSERSAASMPEFQTSFAQRLHSLSRAHDLLVNSEWKSVLLRSLIATELEPFNTKDRFCLEGPAIKVHDKALVNMGMALHELATNSSKHGAWASDKGNVHISWSHSGDQFHFEWRERDGPAVSEGVRQGFGRQVLEKIVPISLDGYAILEFHPHGLRWQLTAPAKQVIEAANAAEAVPVV